MDTSGQAAEQIVRYSIEGMEYTLKLAGKGRRASSRHANGAEPRRTENQRSYYTASHC